MEIIPIGIMVLQAIFFVVVLILLIYLIIKRMGSKDKETFEQRSN